MITTYNAFQDRLERKVLGHINDTVDPTPTHLHRTDRRKAHFHLYLRLR